MVGSIVLYRVSKRLLWKSDREMWLGIVLHIEDKWLRILWDDGHVGEYNMFPTAIQNWEVLA